MERGNQHSPSRFGVESGGEIESCGRSGRACGFLQQLREVLADAAHEGNGIGVLATNEQQPLLREAVQINAAVCVLLDDFETVAAAGAATKLGRGGEGGMREDENRSGRWFHFTGAVEQAARIIGDGGLLDARKRSERFEFHVQSEFTRRGRGWEARWVRPRGRCGGETGGGRPARWR